MKYRIIWDRKPARQIKKFDPQIRRIVRELKSCLQERSKIRENQDGLAVHCIGVFGERRRLSKEAEVLKKPKK